MCFAPRNGGSEGGKRDERLNYLTRMISRRLLAETVTFLTARDKEAKIDSSVMSESIPSVGKHFVSRVVVVVIRE